ncbi:CsgG/HfaB family protein [Aminivibrio sp.]|uniref:CsgG/HfaB family protein n=1 Tax=Aminivibrio sp. TaxID=1872489 RepID=UPI00345EA987
MFRKCTLACIFFVVLCGFSGSAWAKPRIAILEFEDKSGAGAPGEAVADMLTTELFNTNEFTILERQRMDAILSEQDLSSEGYVDSSTAVKMGKLLGVDFLVTGAITQFKTETAGGVVPLPLGSFGGVAVGSHTAYVTLDVRAVSTTTGEILLAAREQGAANATVGGVAAYGAAFGGGKTGGVLASATYKVVTKIVPRISSLRDKAAEAASDAVFNVIEGGNVMVAVDAGAASGISVGQYLAAFREGKVLKDMQGNVLDAEKIYTAVLVVREVKPKYSKCEVIRALKPLSRGEKAEFLKGSPEDLPIGK